MEKTIKEFAKSVGILTTLRNMKINGVLTYRIIDWLGNDACYYSLFAAYNETQVFARTCPLLQDTLNTRKVETAVNPLSSNLRQFQNKEDWVIDKWELDDVRKINEFLKNRLGQLSLDGCDNYECRVVSFGVFLHPVAQYSVNYEFNGKSELCVFLMNAVQVLHAQSPGHAQFLYNIVEALNLQQSVSIVLEGTTWKN